MFKRKTQYKTKRTSFVVPHHFNTVSSLLMGI